MNPEPLSKLIITYGWQGACAVLLIILVWLIKDLMKLHENTAKALSENSQAIRNNAETSQKMLDGLCKGHDLLFSLVREMRDLLMSRPCMRKKD